VYYLETAASVAQPLLHGVNTPQYVWRVGYAEKYDYFSEEDAVTWQLQMVLKKILSTDCSVFKFGAVSSFQYAILKKTKLKA
jgi:hypothetical protein